MESAVSENRIKTLFEEDKLEDRGFFNFSGENKELLLEKGLDRELVGNKDNENISYEIQYTYTKEVKRKKEDSNMHGNTNEDPTYEKLLNVANSLQENLLNENKVLKEYVLNNIMGKSQEHATKQEIIKSCLELYEERILTMNDVLLFTGMSIEKFMIELNGTNGVSFQYEDDFVVKDEDIEDWI